MFKVKQGTQVTVIKEGKEWMSPNFLTHVTQKDNLFTKEEVELDPVGKLGVSNSNTIGYEIQSKGYYGFKKGGWYLIVPAKEVEYLD
jgi:hypothetical protein